MRWFACLIAAGLALIGCGGQARREGAGDGTGHGGAAGGGAPAAVAPVDDENTEGRPVTPAAATGAFFWGSDSSGWHIGNWFVTAGDSRDVGLSEIVPPRDGSTLARRVTDQGRVAGVVLWLELDHPLNRAVDLSTYWGLRFWARLESVSGRLVVALNDGRLESGSVDGKSALPSRTLAVGPVWQEFTLPFDAFPLDRLSLISTEFFVGEGGESFDLWVDELSFLCSGACP
jgi:hypothetical protein